MIESGKAAALLSKSHADGAFVKLCNGDTFLISPMPIGSRGKRFLAQIKQLEGIDVVSEAGMDFVLNFFREILDINYPGITLEDVDGLFDMSHFSRVLRVFYGGDLAAEAPAALAKQSSAKLSG